MVRDLEDVSKIIRENFNSDLADELDKLIPEHTNEEYYNMEDEIENKDTKICLLEYKITNLESELNELDSKIEELEKEKEK